MAAFWQHFHESDSETQNFLSQMIERKRKQRLDNLYWYSKNCIQGYEDDPGMHAGGKEDLYEFQAYTKERVADLEIDIKNLQAVQNEVDGPTSTAIQLVISTIEKRRDLFADLLPKFQEHIDQEHTEYIYANGERFESMDEFLEYNQLQMYLDEYYD